MEAKFLRRELLWKREKTVRWTITTHSRNHWRQSNKHKISNSRSDRTTWIQRQRVHKNHSKLEPNPPHKRPTAPRTITSSLQSCSNRISCREYQSQRAVIKSLNLWTTGKARPIKVWMHHRSIAWSLRIKNSLQWSRTFIALSRVWLYSLRVCRQAMRRGSSSSPARIRVSNSDSPRTRSSSKSTSWN